jgi:predicted phage baseplate assembly protein
MPLPLPSLDRRTWDDLVSEARALIPAYAPEWTDHNVHDPGITLVELFAWLTEMLMFRTDRISPADVRAFLRWFGVAPLPAQPAATVLALRLPPGGSGVMPGIGLKVVDLTTSLVFEADDWNFVSPAWLELSTFEGTRRGEVWSESGGVFTDLSSDNARATFEFWPLGAQPAPGDALWLGFDCEPAPVGRVISLHVWTDHWAGDAEVRRRLIEEEARGRDCPAPEPTWPTRAGCDQGLPPAQPATPPGPAGWGLHYSVRVAWEAWDGTGWQRLEVVEDQTRALTLTGHVRLTVASALQPDPAGAPSAGRWWIRCRLLSGHYDCPPRLAAIAINAVDAKHAALVAGPEVIGSSQGHAGEVFYLQARIVEQGAIATAQPVLAGSIRLRLTDAGMVDERWTEVSNWDRTGPFDRHFVVDPADDSVRFGNGRVGRVPPADWSIEAMEYRVGGGPAGNLPAERLSLVLAGGAPGLTVRQPFPAMGGAAAETLGEAHGRALAMLEDPARAITLGDWSDLALETPGVPVARAIPVPGYLAALGCWTAPGVVTVVVVPSCGHPPVPGPDLLRAVTRYLEPRRPLTTELHVVAPTYVKVTVSATLHVAGSGAGLAARAQAALDAFFDPLTGGPDGSGWPFGRGVLQTDVRELLANLPGVLFVDVLNITSEGGARCDNLALCPTDLVASQAHQITVVEGTP